MQQVSIALSGVGVLDRAASQAVFLARFFRALARFSLDSSFKMSSLETVSTMRSALLMRSGLCVAGYGNLFRENSAGKLGL